MDALRPEFAREALRDGTQPGLRGGEGGEPCAAAQAGGGAGEQHCAAAARQHMARGFTAGHEPGETGELPDPLEQRAGGFQRARFEPGQLEEVVYEPGDADRTPPCGITYLKATNGTPYHLKASITWQITWEGTGGAKGNLPNGTFDTTQDMNVQEIQAINR